VTPEPAQPEPRKPVWKNPFVIAFVIGAIALTVLPFAQRKFLKAPPPGPSLGTWELKTVDGAAFGSAQLLGKVWIASFAPDAPRQQTFGGILRHVEDLGEKVFLVSFVLPGAEAPKSTDPRWVVLTGTGEQLEALVMQHFRPAFVEFAPLDAGTTVEGFAQVPELGVVDQNGRLRGFWPDTELGRGNVINAVRLLAKYGPTP
jgi:cytochrome oxidase Cu insertion factor (SCO1/SenC/PrrC family)